MTALVLKFPYSLAAHRACRAYYRALEEHDRVIKLHDTSSRHGQAMYALAVRRLERARLQYLKHL